MFGWWREGGIREITDRKKVEKLWSVLSVGQILDQADIVIFPGKLVVQYTW